MDASQLRCVRGFSFMWPSFPSSNALEAGLSFEPERSLSI